MIPTGKCPKCGMVVNRVSMETIDVYVGLTQKLRGVSFVCTSCRSVLGVGIDPFALKTDLVNEVVERLRQR